MNKKNLIILSVVVLVMAVLVLVLQQPEEPVYSSELFVPEIAENLDDISRVEIRDSSSQLVMTRSLGVGWLMEQAHNYYVDTDRLAVFLRAISTAQTVEEKTSNPEYYSRLAVDGISPDATGVEVALFWADQSQTILFGSTQGSYRYARVSDQATSWLIDAELDLSLDATDWLMSELFNVAEADVREITIEHSDGELIRVVRGEDGEYSTEDLPEGRELRYATILNSFGSALFNLEFDQVRLVSADEADTATTFQLSDGTSVVFSQVSDNGEEGVSWFRIEMFPTDAEPTVLSTEQISDLRAATDGWEFQLPGYKVDQFVRRMEDLLSPGESDE